MFHKPNPNPDRAVCRKFSSPSVTSATLTLNWLSTGYRCYDDFCDTEPSNTSHEGHVFDYRVKWLTVDGGIGHSMQF